jgi:YVTN family beta-propeller protein
VTAPVKYRCGFGIICNAKIAMIALSLFLLVTPVSAYNAQNAVNYANTWWNSTNPSYNYYENNDCANFVSQSLINGGITFDQYTDSKGSIINCDNLDAWLKSKGYQSQEILKGQNPQEPLWFVPGDVAIFGDASDKYRHAVIAVTGDSNNYATVNAHTVNQYHKLIQFFYDYSTWDRCTYYHLTGTSPESRQYIFQTTDNTMQITGDGSAHTSPWTVSWTDGQSKTISVPSTQSIATGSQYVFISWSGKIASTSSSISLSTGSTTAGTYIANYKKQQVLVVAPNLDICSIPGSGWYDQGTTVHLTAPTVNGYSFVKWQVDGSDADTTPTIDLTMNTYHTAVAVYSQTATTNPPNTPSTPSGSSSGNTGITYSYSTSATDPDGNTVKYTFDWGDGYASDTSYVNSGTSASASHSWSNAGSYLVKAKATDCNGASSGWSGSKTVTITIASSNQLPNTPSTPSGSSSGNTGITYSYSTSATDPDGNTVKYTFDWGDGYTSDTSYVNSGTSASASHSWSNAGSYLVKAKATDCNGASSGWSGSKTVTLSTTSPTSDTWGVIGTIPLTGTALPRQIAINNGKAYVSRSGSQLSVIDLSTNTTLTTVAFSSYPGASPGYVAVSGDNVYVALSNLGSNGQLARINTADNLVSSYIPIGSEPFGVAASGNKIYVTNNVWWTNGDPATVKVINNDTNSVIASIPVGINPVSIAIDPITRKAYVTNSNDLSKSVSVIDTNTNLVTATIATTNPPYAVAVSGNRAYVATTVTNSQGSVQIIDTSTDNIIASVPVGRNPYRIAASGNYVFVANQASNSVSILDITSTTVVATLNVGQSPTGIAFDPSTNWVYVANQGDSTISIIGQISALTPAPVANFSATPTSGAAPLTVQFSDSSINNPTSWSWSFGDGAISSLQNPKHSYTAAGTYTVSLKATNAYGSNTVTNTGYIKVTSSTGAISQIGVFRPSTHTFYLDYNGNSAWNGAATDRQYTFGLTGDLPVSGDWNNGGKSEIGVFRPSTHTFYLDYNGNGVWNGAAIDRQYDFGLTGDLPVSGDWNNDGKSEIGVYRPSTHTFYQDYNGNGVWNSAAIDRQYDFGLTGDLPVSGDWNNGGKSEIGVFRPSTHTFYLDYNGNGAWNGASVDRSYNFGLTGDQTMAGTWG